MMKKLFKDKFGLLKVAIYSAYMYFSYSKAIVCYKMLYKQLRSKFTFNVQTVISILYLFFLSAQLFNVSANEFTQAKRIIRH